MIRYIRFWLGRNLMALGLLVLPRGRVKRELTELLWVWNLKVQSTVAAARHARMMQEDALSQHRVGHD